MTTGRINQVAVAVGRNRTVDSALFNVALDRLRQCRAEASFERQTEADLSNETIARNICIALHLRRGIVRQVKASLSVSTQSFDMSSSDVMPSQND
jgi:hypothetical protein